MELTEIRGLPDKELLAKAQEIRQRVFNLKFKAQTEPVTNPAEVRDLKRTVARIHTVIAERARAGKKPVARGTRAKRSAKRAAARVVAAAAAKKKADLAARTRAAGTKQSKPKAAKAGAKKG
jgi:large subunit ribosomal protein L29